jgi:hypothetical protein
MNVDFKFELGDEVNTENTDKKGIVKTRKFEESIRNGSVVPIIRYYVDFGIQAFNWFDQDKLTFANDDHIKVSPETEKFLNTHALQYVINISLDNKDKKKFLDLTKQLNELHNKKVSE